MKYSDPQLVEQLASAYVLGTLEAGARRRFERLAQGRADVRLAVSRWEARLGVLAGVVQPVQPPPRVWAGIAARTQPAANNATQVAGGRGWLGLAGFGLGGVAAGVLAMAAVLFSAPTLFFTSDQIALRSGGKLPQSYVGLLTDAQGNGKLLVSSLRQGRTMTIKVIGPIAPPAAGKLVLWAVPAEGAAFVLGAIPTVGSAVSMLPDTSEKLLSRVTKLIVTLETTDAPAAPGTVVFSGNCARLW